MAESTTKTKPTKMLTRLVKGFGHMLGSETKTGRAFVAAEKKVTKVMDRLGQSETYLDAVGGMLSQNLRRRAMFVASQENLLRALRLSTSGEMDDLRAEVREVRDQLEALSSQLEVVLAAVSSQGAHKHDDEQKKETP